ncbi:hypothetical protein MTO96_001273 [Rhipicephalus appendiculatus]
MYVLCRIASLAQAVVRSTRKTTPCTPQCVICGDAHMTGDRACKQRFQRGSSRPSRPRQRPQQEQQQQQQEFRLEKESFPSIQGGNRGNRSKSPGRSATQNRDTQSGKNVTWDAEWTVVIWPALIASLLTNRTRIPGAYLSARAHHGRLHTFIHTPRRLFCRGGGRRPPAAAGGAESAACLPRPAAATTG